jgi:hypothetical protein
LARQAVPRHQLQSAMGKRQFNYLGHLGHGPVHRRHPRQCTHRESLAARVQAAQQRLGHDRVTNPLRRDD